MKQRWRARKCFDRTVECVSVGAGEWSEEARGVQRASDEVRNSETKDVSDESHAKVKAYE